MGLRRLFVRQKPKIKVSSSKKDGFSGWIKCSGCFEMIHADELKSNLNCCLKCNYHYRLSVAQRIDLLCDENSFEELFSNLIPTDPLSFADTIPYKSRIEQAQKKSNKLEGAVVGVGLVDGIKTAIGIMDFSFMGGSMGSVVGEKLTRMIEYAISKSLPVVIVSASGGARMQESIFSLMQMAKTSAALTKLSNAKLPFISILTNPTMGGVTASFASLGDIIIAEPKALIGFAGPRVVEQTIKQKLPEGAQQSEFLVEKGMVDCVVPRQNLKKKLSFFLSFLTDQSSLKDTASSKESLEQLLEVASVKQAT